MLALENLNQVSYSDHKYKLEISSEERLSNY